MLKNPHLLLALASLFWAGHWIVARAIVPYASPVGAAFWRWAAAIALLAPFAAPALIREWAAIRRAWRPILFFGTCGTVLYNSVVERIEWEPQRVVAVCAAGGERYEGSHFISTMPIQQLLQAFNPAPPDFVRSRAYRIFG